MKKRMLVMVISIVMVFTFIGESPVNAKESHWTTILKKYEKDDKVNSLIFVKYTKGSKAQVYLYKKDEKKQWKKLLSCKGYVGKRGINKKREGDKKTPTGTFTITKAFGIKSNPGAKIDYLKVKKHHYWCGDRYYNRLVDVKKKPHKCRGEHLIGYKGYYDYGLFLDYNKKCKKGKGSAIFMHCTKKNPYTGGCIAVKKSNMVKIIRNIEKNTKICIYRK